MSKSIKPGDQLFKYYIEDDRVKIVDGILEDRRGKKWVAFSSNTIPDETFPGYRNVGRVWKSGDILWLTKRDDALAKKLFTEYHIGVIKDLQQQIDDVGDKIDMIRRVKVTLGSTKRRSRCFAESESASGNVSQEYERSYREGWDCSNYTDPESYATRKIDMLQKEMYIDLSEKDILHLKTLKSRGAIDAAVRAIINKYWV